MEVHFEPKPMGWRDYWAIAVRRRWCLMGPLFLFGLLAFAVVHVWPRRYRSEALILVEQQQVPAQYVTPNVTNDLQDRLQNMSEQILSRTRLQKLVEQLNLYPHQRAHMTMDAVIAQMRKDIEIQPLKAPRHAGELSAFRIYYSADNPRLAQQTANSLTSLFIEENLEARTQQSVNTTNFFETQLTQARKDLTVQEQRLREYKMRYLGELPEQQSSNLQILSSLEAQLHATSTSLGRAEQQKIYLESLRAEYRAMERSLGAQQSSSTPATPGGTTEAALRDLRKQLAELETKYTSRHPDVVALKDRIAQWETLRQQLETQQMSTPEPGKSAAQAPAEDPALAEVESRLKATRVEIEGYQKEMAELRKRVGEYQSRLSLTPLREQQLSDVTRNYDNSRQNYQSLLQKKLQSELATNLEKQRQGEQFRIIDPPSLPQKPSEPNRFLVILIGWLVGLSVGLGLTVLRETTDETLRGEEAVRRYVQMPVLVCIPVLRSPPEKSHALRRRAVEIAGVAFLTMVSLAMSAYSYVTS